MAGAPSRGQRPEPRFKPGTIRRLLKYMAEYRVRLVLVIICIIASAAASASVSVFLQTLIDDHIVPLLGQANPEFTGLIRVLVVMGLVYAAGILLTLAYNRMLVVIEQGTLKKIRDRMFTHMQTLPIRYFDSHTFGDLMSRYTNDTDTLRQAISQSLPQMLSSLMTVVAAYVSMLYLSVYLAAFVAVFVVIL